MLSLYSGLPTLLQEEEEVFIPLWKALWKYQVKYHYDQGKLTFDTLPPWIPHTYLTDRFLKVYLKNTFTSSIDFGKLVQQYAYHILAYNNYDETNQEWQDWQTVIKIWDKLAFPNRPKTVDELKVAHPFSAEEINVRRLIENAEIQKQADKEVLVAIDNALTVHLEQAASQNPNQSRCFHIWESYDRTKWESAVRDGICWICGMGNKTLE